VQTPSCSIRFFQAPGLWLIALDHLQTLVACWSMLACQYFSLRIVPQKLNTWFNCNTFVVLAEENSFCIPRATLNSWSFLAHHHPMIPDHLCSMPLTDRYVKTTDGTKFEFKPGDVLFQDNTKNSPANTPPEHFSGVVGDEPCQQLIVQLSRPPQVNEPNPFWNSANEKLQIK